MAGRNTSKTLHITKQIRVNSISKLVSDKTLKKLLSYSRNKKPKIRYKLKKEDNFLFALQKLLKRRARILKLTQALKRHLQTQCSLIADFHTKDFLNSQDILRTIKYLAKLPASKAKEAIENADWKTTAHIEGYLLQNRDKTKPITLDFTGEEIVNAAKNLTKRDIFAKSKSGRPPNSAVDTKIAELCYETWAMLSKNTEAKAWRYEDRESNYLKFSSEIYKIIFNREAPYDFIDYLKKKYKKR